MSVCLSVSGPVVLVTLSSGSEFVRSGSVLQSLGPVSVRLAVHANVSFMLTGVKGFGLGSDWTTVRTVSPVLMDKSTGL